MSNYQPGGFLPPAMRTYANNSSQPEQVIPTATFLEPDIEPLDDEDDVE